VTGVASYNVTNPDTGEANVYTVTADVTYAGATCKNVQYTLTVTYLSDGKTKTKDQTIKGDDVSTTLHFQLNNVVADGGGNGSVCVSTTTGSGVGKPYDVAPDPGCVTISADSSGGGGTPQF
jgi:hypothetical protein